jgi:hypothetical protein
MSWTKLLAVNIMVFLGLVLGLEGFSRLAATVGSCWSKQCNFGPLLLLHVRQPLEFTNKLGLVRLDPELGYAPAEGFDRVIDSPSDGWFAKRVTITKAGFRDNGNPPARSRAKILAFGDSFTFGDQVSNSETWPSCLERVTGEEVDNAGVFAYGGAQALRRALKFTATDDYSVLLFGTLVGQDFERDRMTYRWGYPAPAVIQTEGELKWAEVPSAYLPGSKWNPSPYATLLNRVYETSELAAFAFDRFGSAPQRPDVLTLAHPDAAGKNQIVNWTLARFSKLKAPRKFLVLLYARNLDDPDVLQERGALLEAARTAGVPVIDTREVLAGQDAHLMWVPHEWGHHTAAGNEVVCRTIARNLGAP